MEGEKIYEKEPLVILQGDRTKCLSFHHPYCAAGTFSGSVRVYNMNEENEKLVKHVRISTKPIRGMGFHPSGKYLFAGGDDLSVYILAIDGNDIQLKHCMIKLHGDYIRCIRFTSKEPNCLFVSSDDKKYTCWDISDVLKSLESSEKPLGPKLVFKKDFGHYVMGSDIHPTDPLVSAAVSLDGQVIEFSIPNLDEPSKYEEIATKFHDKGVNCVKYVRNGGYLATGSDDYSIIITKRKECEEEEEEGSESSKKKQQMEMVQKIENVHHGNVCCLEERNDYMISGGEDCLLVWHKWNREGFEVEKVLDMKKILGKENIKEARIWVILSFLKFVVVGTDIGLVVFKGE